MSERDAAAEVDAFVQRNQLQVDEPLPGAWDGLGEAANGLVLQSARAGRSLMLAAPAALKVLGTGLTEEGEDAYYRAVDEIGQSAVDFWTPDAQTMGSAARTVSTIGEVVGSVPQIIGTPGTFLLDSGLSPTTDLVREGVDSNTALGVGIANLGANAIGMQLPAAIGSNLATRVASGAGINLATGAAADAGSAATLQAGGYEEQAQRYNPFDGQRRLLDAGLGAVFGIPARAAHVDPILTARNADHFQTRSMPAAPVSGAAQVRHQDAMGHAGIQLARGEPINVARQIDLADFRIPPEAARGAGDPYARVLVALESGGRADARAGSSSATGLHQFTNATWLRTVKSAAPAWAQGQTDAQLLALRTDPAKSGEMELALRSENARVLQAAGQDASTWNLYAAHHFGGAGGVKFARAAGDAPMASLLTDGQLKANGYLRGLTKDQAIANWTKRARRAGLEPDGALVDTDPAGQALRARLVADPEALAREYAALGDSRDGTVLNTDTARELSPEYLADRTRSADVHEAASDFVKELYASRLAEPTPAGKDNLVLFTAGGTGAGKTSGLQALGDRLGSPEIVYDTNMNKLASSVQKVEQALAAGRDVQIAYVYRDPVEALTNGAIPRAQRQAERFGSGRTVPMEEHAKTHAGVRPVMEALAERYKDDPRVQIHAIDNSRGKDNYRVVDLEDLPRIDENTLRERLKTALEDARAAGLDESIYRGFAGSEAADRGLGRDRGAPQTAAREAAQGGSGAPRAEGDRGQVAADSPLDAAARLAAESPDTTLTLGTDADGENSTRTVADELADIQAEKAQAEADAQAFAAAVACTLRRGT